MGLVETHRSFVNTWECDENNHWNVQFYFRAFQQAREVFLAETTSVTGSKAPEVFHVRYHRELPAAQSITVRTGMIRDGDFAGWLVHSLENSETGELSATCLDSYNGDSSHPAALDQEDAVPAMPRGLAHGPQEPVDSANLLTNGSAIISHRSIVRPFETDHENDILFHAIVSRFTDGASHIWTHVGLSTDWLDKNNCGRVAVETRLARLAKVQSGQAIRMVSRVTGRTSKSFEIVHQLENIADGTPVAIGNIRCVIMDLETRKVIPLPDVMT
ncbi:MAG: thioesterase family protein [Rhizobiaceae bacterium]